MGIKFWPYFFCWLLVVSLVAANADYSATEQGVLLKARAMSIIMVASILVTSIVILAIISKTKFHNHKRILFLMLFVPIIVATFYVAGTTIYLNSISITKGPVHWHADFEVWNCGEKIDLLDPRGLSNRIGTPVFHEHNDNRMHVEGVVVKKEDVSLQEFFRVVGGTLTKAYLEISTNQGKIFLQEGNLCNGKEGEIQVFVYKVTNPEEQGNWIYTQEKIENFTDYILSPYAHVPPGDCIIIEFDQKKEKTEQLCATFRTVINRGELRGS